MWLTKFNCGLVKLKNMVFILLSGHFMWRSLLFSRKLISYFLFEGIKVELLGDLGYHGKERTLLGAWKQLFIALWYHDITFSWGEK